MKRIFLLSIFCFLLDFCSKRLVLEFLVEDESIMVIKDFFYLTYVKNTGVAFSLLEGNMLFIIGMTLLVLVLIFNYVKDSCCNKIETICYGLIFGGALANLFDRVFYGYVVDFLEFCFWGYSFPIFNLADCMIVIGVVLLGGFSLIESRGNNVNTSRGKS